MESSQARDRTRVPCIERQFLNHWITREVPTILFRLDAPVKIMAILVAQMVKRLPAMRETRVQSLACGDLLEKEMATHSSIFVWKIPWTEEPGRLQSMGLQRVGHD